jgi:hypothetical protein
MRVLEGHPFKSICIKEITKNKKTFNTKMAPRFFHPNTKKNSLIKASGEVLFSFLF